MPNEGNSNESTYWQTKACFVVGLAALVTQYVDAINTPGFVPNVQCAWDLFVETKCFETKKACEQKYDELMTLQLSEVLPCDNDEIRAYHNSALEETEELLLREMIGISTNTVEKQLRQLKVKLLSCNYDYKIQA